MVVSSHSVLKPISLKVLWVLFVFAATGFFFVLLNIELPVTRNALDYAKSTQELLTHHYDVYAVVHNQLWAGGKPILFSLLAVPFASISNASTGTVLASALGTIFFFLTTLLALSRLNRGAGLQPDLLPLQFTLTVFNPLVLYQFWSSYPDSLFSGFILLSFYLIDTIAQETDRDTRPHMVALGLTLCAAIYTKLYGTILVIACPLYLFWYRRQIFVPSRHFRSTIALLGLAFAAPALVVITAKLGVNPWLIFSENIGFGDYVDGLWGSYFQDATQAISMLCFFVVLALHLTLPFGLTRNALRAWRGPPKLFFGVYLLGLLPASGSSYNMRYFIPILPFLAAGTGVGVHSLSPSFRRALMGSYITLALILVLTFNIPSVEETAEPLIAHVYETIPQLSLWLDNLRLPVQIELKKQIDEINTHVPSGSVLYWSSDYSGPATHGLAHQLGVKNDLDVRYVLEPSDPPPSSESVYLTEFTSANPPEKLWRAPDWSTPHAVGRGLFRLDPISVKLISPTGDYVKTSEPIRLEAILHKGTGVPTGTPHFLEDGRELSADLNQPLQATLNRPALGRHKFTAHVDYGYGEATVSAPLVVYAGIPAFERVADTTDDLILEVRGGSIWATQDLLWLDQSERLVGIRFQHINLPRGTYLAHAYLRLTAAAKELGTTTLNVRGELAANSVGLTFADGNLSSRPRTSARQMWSLEPWTTVGQESGSPDLASVLNEILSQAEWRSGNAVMLLIHVSGHSRVARTFDIDGRGTPVLYVELFSK